MLAIPDDYTAETAYGAAAGIVDQIEALPAKTPAGLKANARAFSWCRCGDPVTAKEWFGPGVTTDVRLMGSAS